MAGLFGASRQFSKKHTKFCHSQPNYYIFQEKDTELATVAARVNLDQSTGFASDSSSNSSSSSSSSSSSDDSDSDSNTDSGQESLTAKKKKRRKIDESTPASSML